MKTSRRYRLSAGGRARNLPDFVELLVARRLGRDLSTGEGLIVQILAFAMFGLLVWGLFASGLIIRIIDPFAHWYASQLHFGPTAPPSALPR